MLNRFTFDTSFTSSGDLRSFLAINPKTITTFRPTTEFDELIHIDRSQEPHKLSYDIQALKRRDEFLEKLGKAAPIASNRSGRPLDLNGMYRSGTCILIGSGPSLDLDFVRTLQEQGICVIALGNASFSYKAADYWIGLQGVRQYAPGAFLESRTKALVPLRNKEDTLWDFKNRKETEHKVKDCPGIAYYKLKSAGIEEFFESPCITTFGVNTSTGLGISLAVCLGFNNIILSGVDMGGEISHYYSFDEMPHKDTYDRKTSEYSRFLTIFDDIKKGLNHRAIRLYGAGISPFNIPVLEKEYLIRSTSRIAYLNMPALDTPRGLTVPMGQKHSYESEFAKHRSRRIDEKDFQGIRDHLLAVSEGLFDVPEVHKAYDDLDKKLAGGSGCASCAIRATLRPIYRLFVAYNEKDPENFARIWEKIFPDKYTILAKGRSELTFRYTERYLETEMNLRKGT